VRNVYVFLCPACEEKLNPTRTGCGEEGIELDFSGGIYAVPIANTLIAARREDASSAHAEQCEQGTQSLRIFPRDSTLIRTVRHADGLRDDRPVEGVLEPVKVQVARAWLPPGQDLLAVTVAAVVDDRGRIRNAQGVLGVEVCPPALAHATVERYDSEGCGVCAGAKLPHERHQIGCTRLLISVACNRKYIPIHRDGIMGLRLVQPFQKRWIDDSDFVLVWNAA
jgi:hypothetical protein